jgi:hypothetical protein
VTSRHRENSRASATWTSATCFYGDGLLVDQMEADIQAYAADSQRQEADSQRQEADSQSQEKDVELRLVAEAPTLVVREDSTCQMAEEAHIQGTVVVVPERRREDNLKVVLQMPREAAR